MISLPQKKYQDTTPTCTSATPPSPFTSMTEQETGECISDAESIPYDECVVKDEEQSDETDCDDNLFEENFESVDTPASLSSNLIYPNARISNAVSMLTFAITNKLSGSVIQDLLSLIDLHCMVPHQLIKSLYTIKQYFKALKNPLKRHYYCSQCCLSITANCVKCPNVMCNQELTDNKKSFSIEIPIVDQLKALFSRKGFYNDLQYRFNHKNAEKLSDIYDGTTYQKLMQSKKFLSFPGNISFTWNTDGIPVFKSSKYCIWPLYFAINELPIHRRWCSENLLLAGLWFGYQKPNMLTYLKPF